MLELSHPWALALLPLLVIVAWSPILFGSILPRERLVLEIAALAAFAAAPDNANTGPSIQTARWLGESVTLRRRSRTPSSCDEGSSGRCRGCEAASG